MISSSKRVGGTELSIEVGPLIVIHELTYPRDLWLERAAPIIKFTSDPFRWVGCNSITYRMCRAV